MGSRAAVLDSMFAPPICRRRRRNYASRTELAVSTSSFRRIRRRRRLPGEHRCERSEPLDTARTSSQPTYRVLVLHDCWLRVSEEGSGLKARSARSERSERSNQMGSRAAVLDSMFAPPICRRRRRNGASRTQLGITTPAFRRIGRRRRLPGEHRRERSEPSNTARSERSNQMGSRAAVVDKRACRQAA
jgi:hypothetical protein